MANKKYSEEELAELRTRRDNGEELKDAELKALEKADADAAKASEEEMAEDENPKSETPKMREDGPGVVRDPETGEVSHDPTRPEGGNA